jgi:hypothetical protein
MSSLSVVPTFCIVLALGGGAAWYFLRSPEVDQGRPKPDPAADLTGLVVGPGHLATIAEAIAKARTDAVDTIKILPGTYNEAVRPDRKVRLLGEGPRDSIVIRGGNAPALTVECDGVAVSGLTLRSGPGRSTTVRITAGDAELKDLDISWEAGAGADLSRGGVCVEVDGAAARPTLDRCTLHDGRIGLLLGKGADPTLQHCTIESNHIGVQAEDGKGRLADCRLENNHNMGVYFRRGAELRLEGDCRVLKGAYGMVFDAGSRGHLNSCKIDGQDNDGIWIKEEGAEPQIIGCHVTGAMNAVNVTGGKGTLDGCSLTGSKNNGLLVKDGQIRLTNCHLDGNHFHGAYVLRGGVVELHRCTTSDNQEGSGVRAVDGGVARLFDCGSRKNKLWGLEARGAGSQVNAQKCKSADIRDNAKGPWEADSEATLNEPGE